MKGFTGFMVFLLLLASAVAMGQKRNTTDEALLKQGMAYYEQQNYVKAINTFDRIVKDKNKVSEPVYAKALFYIPKICMEAGKMEDAKRLFDSVIVADIYDSDTTGDPLSAFANYKHSASLFLAQLYYNDSNFNATLSWLYKADTLYPYYASPQNPTAAIKSAAGILDWEVTLLQRLDRKEEAIQRIVYELICAQQFGGYFNNQESSLIGMIGDKAAFVKELNAALDGMQVNTIDDKNQEAVMTLRNRAYRFHIANEAPHNPYIIYKRLFVTAEGRKMSSQAFAGIIRNSLFYKRLIN